MPTFDSFIQQFLRQEIINTQFIFIDLWSFVHLISGIILGLLLPRYFKKYSWLIVLVILISYEFFEVFLIGILFVSESPVDTIWDIIIGITGFAISIKIAKYAKIKL